MDRTLKLNFFALLGCIVAIVVCILAARAVETDFGRVQVSLVQISSPAGVELTGKLYVPITASETNKLPAVLGLHGFQNDKETQDAFAIELARRGFVVLALDQYGHGSSGGRMALSAQDPTMGGDAGYDFLKVLPYVDQANIGVMGHSMGAENAIALAEANADVRAVNPQCGTAGNPELNNLLLTQARFEEFLSFRENQPTVKSLTTNAERLAAFGLTGEALWDTTYGSFADGSARRQTLINTVHPGVTHNRKAVAETLTWMNAALYAGRFGENWIDPAKQIFMWKEVATLLALLFALLSMLPLTNLLLNIPYFSLVAQPLPEEYLENRPYTATERAWNRYAWLNNLVAGVSYPILTGLGGYLVASKVPALSMIIANGVSTWFLGNALIYLLIFTIWYLTHRKKRNVTLFNMGLSFHLEKLRINGRYLGKAAILGGVLLGWLYLLVFLSQRIAGIEFRFLWPFMREFSLVRFGYFWVYLLPALLFFLLNGGVFLFGQAHQHRRASGAETQLVWWLKNCLAALAGLVVVWAFQYIPFFLGFAPGFELVGLPLLSGMIPLLLFVYIPEFIVLLFFLTWFYRRTGKIYLGALVIASLAVWWLTAGTAM
jgi:dienelactone hydrolase